MKAHWYLIRTRWLRVYINGNYSACEIMFGRPGRDIAVHFGTPDGWVKLSDNRLEGLK